MMWGGLWGNRTTPFPASSNRSAGLHEGWGPSEPVPLRCPGPWQPHSHWLTTCQRHQNGIAGEVHRPRDRRDSHQQRYHEYGNNSLSAATQVSTVALSNGSNAALNLNGGTTQQPQQAMLNIGSAAGFGTAGVLTGNINLSGNSLLELSSGDGWGSVASASKECAPLSASLLSTAMLATVDDLERIAGEDFGVKQRSIISTSFFLLSFVPSLCSTGAIIPSSRPALRSRRRAGAVKVGRRTPTLRHAPPLPPHLDSFEPDGTLGAIGMTIRGEPAFGRGSIAPQPCIRWARGPEP